MWMIGIPSSNPKHIYMIKKHKTKKIHIDFKKNSQPTLTKTVLSMILSTGI
jgi:hypothetical protein